MAPNDKRKDSSKPVTRGNTSATPAPSRPRNPTLPQGMRDAGLLATQRVDERAGRSSSRNPEALQSPRDAGSSGIRCRRVEEPATPTLQEDPRMPLGYRDAGPSGLRLPQIEDSSTPTYYLNPVAPQGPRDASPSSELRSGVDDTPRQPSCQYSTPASERTPKRRAEIGVHALMTNTRTDYERRYGKLPANNAPSRASREVITPTPTTAPTIPSDNEDSELSR